MSQVEHRIQWARAFKVILDAGAKGVAIYDLADMLEVKRGSKELNKTIDQLVNQGRVKIALGKSIHGLVCRVVYPNLDHAAAIQLLKDEDHEGPLISKEVQEEDTRIKTENLPHLASEYRSPRD